MLSYIISMILISLFLIGCKSKTSNVLSPKITKLNGKWEVVKSSFVPFEHISFCETLEIGSIFIFEDSGELKVFNKGENKNCNGEQYFELDSNLITIQEWDMIFNYEIKKLESDSLIFVIRRMPSFIFEDSIDVKVVSDVAITDPNFYSKFRQEGIEVKLVRKDDD